MTDKNKCSVRVDWDKWFHNAPCRRPATIERNGKWYCTIHDPEYIEKKEAERSKKWEKEFNLKIIGRIAANACQKINPGNPRAVAESLELMYEALKSWGDSDMSLRQFIELKNKILAKANSKEATK